jgi:hypothetical protein
LRGRSLILKWQQEAIDHIVPLLSELAAGTQSVIEHLNATPEQLQAFSCKQYVKAKHELAAEPSEVIVHFVDHGQTKVELEMLKRSLRLLPREVTAAAGREKRPVERSPFRRQLDPERMSASHPSVMG